MPDAITIAVLAAIESCFSCVVADGMIGGKHNSNAEAGGPGVGNAASALFGGIPAIGRHRKGQSCQHKERRAQSGGRHGPRGGASADSGISYALCGSDSHAR